MFRIISPSSVFEKTCLGLRMNRGRVAVCRSTLNERRGSGTIDILTHEVVGFFKRPDMSRVGEDFYPLFIRLFRSDEEQGRADFERQVAGTDKGLGLYFITDGESMWGYFVPSVTVRSSDPVCLSLRGPGMERMMLTPSMNGGETPPGHQNGGSSNSTSDSSPRSGNAVQRLDRFAGWVGRGNLEEGFRITDNARHLRVGIVGIGRSGNQVAIRLAQEGVGAIGGLILIDPDIVEASNLDGMIVPPAAVGYPKAVAVASIISALFPDSRPFPINRSLSEEEAVDALKTCDMVFTCVDEDAARYATAIIASLNHIVHIDISGGSSWDWRGQAITGGEMRAFICGSQGCLVCYGNYDRNRVQELMSLTRKKERARRTSLNWREQRAGSSVDVLLPVIGESIQTFWDILRGEIRQSHWWHYEKGPGGSIIWEDWTDRRKSRNCPVCNEMPGLGDTL